MSKKVMVKCGMVSGVSQLLASQVIKSGTYGPAPPHASLCSKSWKRKVATFADSERDLGWYRLITPSAEPSSPLRFSRLLLEASVRYWSSENISMSTQMSPIFAILASRIVPVGPAPPPPNGHARVARSAWTFAGTSAHIGPGKPPRLLHAVKAASPKFFDKNDTCPRGRSWHGMGGGPCGAGACGSGDCGGMGCGDGGGQGDGGVNGGGGLEGASGGSGGDGGSLGGGAGGEGGSPGAGGIGGEGGAAGGRHSPSHSTRYSTIIDEPLALAGVAVVSKAYLPSTLRGSGAPAAHSKKTVGLNAVPFLHSPWIRCPLAVVLTTYSSAELKPLSSTCTVT